MDIEERVSLIKQVGQEVLTEDELRELLASKKNPLAYDGFEPSGQIHIAQGLLRTININRMLEAGCDFTFLIADWHAWINNKYGGDMEKIKTAGEYFIEVWKACGLKDGVEFVWSSEMMGDPTYWEKVIQIGRHSTLTRVLRTTQIMGRSEKDELSAAQIFYPCMQAADIFHMDIDICQLGMDQRKVNILARELGPKLFGRKPVAVHHHMLLGLQQQPHAASGESGKTDAVERAIAMKMSKSNPASAIFMTDDPDVVTSKIAKAYCPERKAEDNPVLEYCRHIIFARMKTLRIDRPEKFGGPLELGSYDELAAKYVDGHLHPMDLKKGVAGAINDLLDPIRMHFAKGKPAKLLEQIRSFDITR